MKSLRLTAMLCAVLFLGMTGCEPKAAESEPDSPAETTVAGAAVTPLPAVTTFTAQTMDGGTFTSEDLAAADITVINIWQTTCPPCISEMPELARLEKALPDNVRFVTWCLDAPTYPGTSKHIMEKAGFEGTTLISAEGDLLTMVYQVMYTPTTVFLDSKGNHAAPELVGSPEQTIETYMTYINAALREVGKEDIVINLD
ncbi:MAG: TlpA family protein disulfide reductase [Oscillospiraceae bacterium]|nr:TlpA family protein disulfide reductase [Oscillospiraceae bacterium]